MAYRIAVIFPSRGLAFSTTCEELLENLEEYDHDIFFAHGLPIPDCFNIPLERALKGIYTHFWLVEDDMILPKDTLKQLLAERAQAIVCDYPVAAQGKASVYRDPNNNAIYGGTGCLLVTRRFLKSFRQPIFRTDIAWDIKIGDTLEMTPRRVKGDVYGLHDVTFGLLAYERGLTIQVSDIRCGQRKLKALGPPSTNNSVHLIESWTALNPEKLELKEIKNRNVFLKDGTRVFMDIDRARELAKQGKVTIPLQRYVTLTRNRVLKAIL